MFFDTDWPHVIEPGKWTMAKRPLTDLIFQWHKTAEELSWYHLPWSIGQCSRKLGRRHFRCLTVWETDSVSEPQMTSFLVHLLSDFLMSLSAQCSLISEAQLSPVIWCRRKQWPPFFKLTPVSGPWALCASGVWRMCQFGVSWQVVSEVDMGGVSCTSHVVTGRTNLLWAKLQTIDIDWVYARVPRSD